MLDDLAKLTDLDPDLRFGMAFHGALAYDPVTGAVLDRSNGYTRGGGRRYYLLIPPALPSDPLWWRQPGDRQIHRFTAWSYAEALDHARAYLAKHSKKGQTI